MPRIESWLLFLDSLKARGSALYREMCRRDLEGIVAKWRHGRYETNGISKSWLKVKNPDYSQMAGRYELFDRRQPAHTIPRCRPDPCAAHVSDSAAPYSSPLCCTNRRTRFRMSSRI